MAAKATVRFTANIEANLSVIESWWRGREAPQGYAHLVERLEGVVDDLERLPRLGRDFLARVPHSVEAVDRLARLRTRLERFELREYLAGDYLMLYAFDPASRPPVVHMLAIRHHRELSFEFDGFWQANRGPARSRP